MTFFVALPLCVGIAMASGAPAISGVIAGIVAGVVVGWLSGAQVMISGPAAGLVAVVAAELTMLGSLEALLLAVVMAGLIQIALGLAQGGFIKSFVPTSVVRGLLSAIGVILILKQIPHLVGHDTDYEGEMSFFQPDRENTFSELLKIIGDLHPGAMVVGLGSLVLLWIILLSAGALFLGRRIWTLIRYIRQPLMIAFSTASSEAALPKLFEQLDRFGVPRRISGFMLPLGYSFNLDGSMMYMSFATIFIAQAYGIDLSIGTQIMILLTLMISSKGIAAVPRASLVVITGTLAMFGLPVEGVAIILAIDQFLDMGRTATNVVGNAVATAVITKWEGMLEVEEPAYVEHPHAPAHTAADGRAGLELDESNFEDGKG